LIRRSPRTFAVPCDHNVHHVATVHVAHVHISTPEHTKIHTKTMMGSAKPSTSIHPSAPT